MKGMAIKSLIFICTLFLTASANAQRYWDYVITVKGDSLRCNITSKFLGGTLFYKTGAMIKPEKITTAAIKEYYSSTEQKLYRAVFLDKEGPYFLSVLEKGKINLYERIVYNNTGSSIPVTVWSVGKGADSVVDLKFNGVSVGKTRQQRKNDFAKLIMDDVNVYAKFTNDDKFSYDQIRNIIHLYNTGEFYEESITASKFARDYAITKNNDTIFCTIKNDYFKGYFTYKQADKTDFTKIDSSLIGEYFYSRYGVSYTWKSLPDQKNSHYVKWLERGAINLFEWTRLDGDPQKQTTKYYWYINKGPAPLIPIKVDAKSNFDIRSDKQSLNTFENIISDDSSLLKEFKQDIKMVDPNYPITNTDFLIRLYINRFNKEYLKNQGAN